MTCSGIGVFSGRPIEIGFEAAITSVTSGAETSATYVAPAWIDLQVNGFAGVDYNDPATPHEQIARSMERIFATGTARFFPTVITGPPDSMLAALRNLARARETLENGDAMERFHV